MVKVLSFTLQQGFDPFAMLSVERSSETRFGRHLSNHLFGSRAFRKHISYEDHPYLKNVLNLKEIVKMQKKIEKNVLFLR